MERTSFSSPIHTPDPSKVEPEFTKRVPSLPGEETSITLVLQAFDGQSKKLASLFQRVVDGEGCKEEFRGLICQLKGTTERLVQKLDVTDLKISKEIASKLESTLRYICQSESLLNQLNNDKDDVASPIVDLGDTLLSAHKAAYRTILASQLP